MTKSTPTDPLTTAIEAAVERAVERALPKLIDAMPHPVMQAQTLVAEDTEDRIVGLAEAATMLGAHRTTLLRYEALGKLPQRRKLPGGKTGYLLSDLRTFMSELPQAPKPVLRPSRLTTMQGGRA